MRSALLRMSLGLLPLIASHARAEGTSERRESGDSWFGAPTWEPLYPVDEDGDATPAPAVPPTAARPQPKPPSGEAASQAQRKSSASPRWSGVVPIRFEPDDPSVQLLTQSGVLPFESVAHYHWSGWWSWPHTYGYGPPYGYYRETGVAPIYTPICDGACMAHVRKGPHQFALSRPGGPIVPIPSQAVITGASMIRANYVDRSDLRSGGIVIGVLGSLTGLVMMILSVHDEQVCDAYTCTLRSGVDEALAVSGLGVFAGSVVTSAILINQKDEARISISPLRLPQPEVRSDVPRAAHSRPQLGGASLSMRF